MSIDKNNLKTPSVVPRCWQDTKNVDKTPWPQDSVGKTPKHRKTCPQDRVGVLSTCIFCMSCAHVFCTCLVTHYIFWRLSFPCMSCHHVLPTCILILIANYLVNMSCEQNMSNVLSTCLVNMSCEVKLSFCVFWCLGNMSCQQVFKYVSVNVLSTCLVNKTCPMSCQHVLRTCLVRWSYPFVSLDVLSTCLANRF